MTYLDFNSGTAGTSISGFTLVPPSGGSCTFQYASGGTCSFVSTSNLGQAIYTAGPSASDSSVQITETIQFTGTGSWQSQALILNSDSAGTTSYHISFDMQVSGGRVVVYKLPGYSVPSGGVGSGLGLSLATGSQFTFRASRTGSTISAWVWPAGTAQPSTPSLTFTDGSPLGAGYAGVALFQVGASGGTSTGDDFFVGVPSDTFTAGGGALAAGTASVSAIGTVTATVTATAATGGTSPYSYQWQRKTGSGGTYANVSGATSLTLNDTGLTQGTTYLYKCVQTDSASAVVTTNEVTVTAKIYRLVCHGNSQTVGISATPYPTIVASYLPSTWAITNAGTSGQTTADMVTNAPSQVVPLLLSGNTLNVVVAQEVMNHIYFNTTGSVAYATLVTYSNLVRNVNGSKLLVICPQPDRNDFPNSSTIPGSPSAQRAFYQAEVANFMALFLPNWRLICDGYIDPGQDPRLSDISNGTYTNVDGVHWTTAGETVVAEKLSAAMPMTINPRNRVQWVG